MTAASSQKDIEIFKEEIEMEERLTKAFGKNPGWKVPEGYFDSFYKEMGEKLPPYKMAPESPVLSKWQRVKPYLYLAAMFAGIWMMMKVFHTASQNASLNLDNPPEHIAMLMESDPDFDLYAEPEYHLEDYDALIQSYDDMSQLEKDMGIKLEPGYENLDIEEFKEE